MKKGLSIVMPLLNSFLGDKALSKLPGCILDLVPGR